MPITVNRHELSDADVATQLADCHDDANPVRAATVAAILRRVLLDEAERLCMPGTDEHARIEALLTQAVCPPEPDEAACRRHYQQHPAHFTVGELAEVDHILFQVTADASLAALRALAEQTLAELSAHPERFAEHARALSNCPSGAVGGSLGQLQRGDAVPEFERAVFAAPVGTVAPRLVATRFGLHIIRVRHRVAGRLLPFEAVAAQIATALAARSRDIATRQYLQLLVGQARISGIELDGAATPLLQ
ncbi:peptidylprolyl isomerase [Chitiniphilus purpureus]|uniref:peptidylprolyl isomerase n=1 Tax=Chitiniphilus purpureus TaxID=2981137 RepID=A0ABY6DNA2_9NEIS|nr:peptidylprolyl isomerase [Chitiniphilus sp. CD1]UXY15850.1 peptidylprolyl isomerase [Chitiniphilus sp. CD1]